MYSGENIVDALNKEIDALKEALARGHADSYETYKGLCGQIRGLSTAIRVVTDLAKQQENDDDD
jgi:hypothetical protein